MRQVTSQIMFTLLIVDFKIVPQRIQNSPENNKAPYLLASRVKEILQFHNVVVFQLAHNL